MTPERLRAQFPAMAVIAEQIPLSRRALFDSLQRLAFHLSWIKKRRLIQRRQTLSTVEDYFRFSRKVFKLVQMKPEILGFIERVRRAAPTVVCEIGTRSCGTSFMLSQAVESVQTFIGLDLYVSNWTQLRAFARPNQQLHAIVGSSYDEPAPTQVKQILAGRPIDLLFIDGDHSYEGAVKDFQLYRHLVRPGGLIALHDIMPDRRAETGRSTGPYAGGVPKLWNAIKAAYPHEEFVADRQQEGFGIGVVEYDPAAAEPLL